MHKCNKMAACAASGLFVYKQRSRSLQLGKPRDDVVYFNANVVYSRAALFKKSGDGRIFMRRLKQFDSAFAYRQHRDLYALLFDDFSAVKLKTEHVAVEFQRFVKRFNCNSKVIYFHNKRENKPRSPRRLM